MSILSLSLTVYHSPPVHSDIDVSIDGADSIDLNTLTLVKGGGGALLQEKMVESTCKKFIVVADASKLANGLGPHFDLPVEITQVFFKFCVTSFGLNILKLVTDP